MQKCQLFRMARDFANVNAEVERFCLVNDIFFMDQAYVQALKAYKFDEVPIGAVLVDAQGKVVARAYNQMEHQQSQLAHAELQVLAKYLKKNKNWRLSGTTLYVTIQPCLMCLGALYLSRVSRVVYGCGSLKFGATASEMKAFSGIYKNLKTSMHYLNYEKSKKLLRLFFKQKRSPGL